MAVLRGQLGWEESVYVDKTFFFTMVLVMRRRRRRRFDFFDFSQPHLFTN